MQSDVPSTDRGELRLRHGDLGPGSEYEYTAASSLMSTEAERLAL